MPAKRILAISLLFLLLAQAAKAAIINTNVFIDQPSSGWLLDSWATVTSQIQTSVVHSGSSAISVVNNDAWSGFMLEQRSADWSVVTYIQPFDQTHLSFYISAGATVDPNLGSIYLSLDNGSNIQPLSRYVTISQPNTWYHVQVPISDINDTNAAYFRLVFFNNSTNTNIQYYIDDVTLQLDTSIPTPTPTATPGGDSSGVTMTLKPAQNQRSISPYIYGQNWAITNSSGEPYVPNVPFYRAGGNRWTGYNWENNASNAGMDWGPNSSDDYLGGGNTPGEAVRSLIAYAHNHGAAQLVTLPIVDYVAADKNGLVTTVATDTNPRWMINRQTKSSALSLTPDLTDRYVYQAEFVNFIETTFQSARAAGKQIFYLLDNEPALWPITHPLIHPQAPTYAEMLQRTTASASMIKTINPNALVFGAVCYGFNEYYNLQNATDANGREYLDFLLAGWRDAATTSGHRLVDDLDLHWYPEAQGSGMRICNDHGATPAAGLIEARVQAPRSLWDTTYREDSWIADFYNGPIYLLPRLFAKISANYPGTALSFSEYEYGGDRHISGAIAEADVLGIFGRDGVFAANRWPADGNPVDPAQDYVLGGFAAYLNYDGQGHKVGDTSVSATTSDAVRTSVYAIADSRDNTVLYVIAINKTALDIPAQIMIGDTRTFGTASVYRVTPGHPQPQSGGTLAFQNNQATYRMPAYSVSTLVLSLNTTLEPEKIQTLLPTQDSIIAFPNPAKGHVTFAFGLLEPAAVEINIYNTAGERICNLKADLAANPFATVPWDKGSVPPGVYFCRLKLNQNGKIKTYKTIKVAITR